MTRSYAAGVDFSTCRVISALSHLIGSQRGFFVPGEPRTGDTRRNLRDDRVLESAIPQLSHRALSETRGHRSCKSQFPSNFSEKQAAQARDTAVAKNSNADSNTALCFTACPQTGVLQSSDDTLCKFAWGLSPQLHREHAPCVRNWNINSLHFSALLNPVLWDDLQDFDNSDLSLTGRGNHTALKLANTSLNNANTNKATQDTTTLPSTSGWDLPYSRKP